MIGLLTFALITIICSVGASPAYALDVGRYGSIKIVEPHGQVRGVVIFFSGRKGLSPADETAAQAIAKGGALVVEVDSREYLSRLDKIDEKCHELVYDAEWVSRQLQRERGVPNYLTPIVAGVGEGGTLAEMILAEAPAVTIAGAVSIDPSATIVSRRPICSEASATAGRKGFRYSAQKKLPGYWTVGLTHRVRRTDRKYIEKLRRAGAPLDLHEIAANMTVGDALHSLIEPHLAIPRPAVASLPTVGDISDLPLIELPVNHPSKLMVVALSGDGGWRDLDKRLGADLQQQGVPVVGLDSLRYFWSKKTPEQTARMVAALTETFMAKWHADKVALIGYSFGADVMPFVYNRLPQSLRAHVVMITLLGLAKSANFEISIREWLGESETDALPVMPEAIKIPPRMMQCFYGRDEGDTACPALAQRGVETFRRNGGHHFDGNYAAVADLIVAGLKQRAGLAG